MRDFGALVRLAVRRLSSAMDWGSISHWPLPGRPGCFCFSPVRRPRLSRRQTSALVVFISPAACWAVSQRSRRAGIAIGPSGRGGAGCAPFTLAVVIGFYNSTGS